MIQAETPKPKFQDLDDKKANEIAVTKRPRPDESPDPEMDRPQKRPESMRVIDTGADIGSVKDGDEVPSNEAGVAGPVKASRFKLRKEGPSASDVPENELDPSRFPPMGLIHMADWNPLDEKAQGGEGRPKQFLLEDFSFLKNQTLVFKVNYERYCLFSHLLEYAQITVPSSSREFALNIGPEENITHPPGLADRPDFAQPHSWQEVALHFNPRYSAKKKEIMFVDMKDWMWGISDRRPFSSFNVLPVGNFTLMIQVQYVDSIRHQPMQI